MFGRKTVVSYAKPNKKYEDFDFDALERSIDRMNMKQMDNLENILDSAEKELKV
jgi:hypothetical protein